MKLLIKKLVKEALFDKHNEEQLDLLNTFTKFACHHLGIEDTPIHLQFTHQGLTTTAAYGKHKVKVYAKERALADIMRSIAHELTHYKQDLEGRLDPKHHDANNAAGSPQEDEANYKSGEIIRKFGETHPEIYP